MNEQQKSRIAFSVVLALLCLWAAAVDAQTVRVSQPKVSLEVKEAKFQPTVEKLFKQARARYRITLGAEAFGDRYVTLQMKDVPLEQAIRQLIAVGGLKDTLVLTSEKGKYLLKLSDKLSCTDKAEPHNVTLSLQDATLEEALLKVFQQAGMSYAFTVDGITAQKVSLNLKDVPHDKAIAMVLATARPRPDLTYREPNRSFFNQRIHDYIAGVYLPVVTFRFKAANGTEALKEASLRKVTVYFENENLSDAMEALLRLTGASFAAPSALSGYHIRSMSLKNRPLGEVLDRMMAETKKPYTTHFLFWPRYANGMISIESQKELIDTP